MAAGSAKRRLFHLGKHKSRGRILLTGICDKLDIFCVRSFCANASKMPRRSLLPCWAGVPEFHPLASSWGQLCAPGTKAYHPAIPIAARTNPAPMQTRQSVSFRLVVVTYSKTSAPVATPLAQ